MYVYVHIRAQKHINVFGFVVHVLCIWETISIKHILPKLHMPLQELECHMRLALQFGTPVPTAKSTQPAPNLFTGVDRCCLPTGTWHSSSTVTRKVGTPVPTKRKNGHSSSMHATNLAVQFHGCKNPRPTISAAVVTCTCM